jgi:glycosyltransferase involved in cell wall biosynthesis
LNIGIIKPDYKITGGYEVVVNHMKIEMERFGHNVQIIHVDASIPSIQDIPSSIPNNIYYSNLEFFHYINEFWKYLMMDLNDFDVLISTQPPSFAVNHNRHVALFYHHKKIYYDLSNLIQEVGLQQPYHRKAVEVVREIDTISLSKVSTILAGSQTIKRRLEKYNHLINNVDVIYAGIDPKYYNFDSPVTYENPIVVGRHEFPKRPELFVAAMKHIPNLSGRVVGSGGRTDDLKKIDLIMTYAYKNKITIEDEIIWKKMSNGFFIDEHEAMFNEAKRAKLKSNIIFTGRVSEEELFKEYTQALCVVCPAFEEDYGLTAIEAMAFKKPVIACVDGGGYAELIEHGVNGLLVEPKVNAISDAIQYLNDNKDIAMKMGNEAYKTSRRYSWENTIKKLMEALKF